MSLESETYNKIINKTKIEEYPNTCNLIYLQTEAGNFYTVRGNVCLNFVQEEERGSKFDPVKSSKYSYKRMFLRRAANISLNDRSSNIINVDYGYDDRRNIKGSGSDTTRNLIQ